MTTLRFGASAAAIAVSLVALATPVRAAVFAQFSPNLSDPEYKWVQSVSQTGGHFFTINSLADTSAQGVNTHFTFFDPALNLLVFLPTTFTLDALVPSGNPAVSFAGLVSQGDLGGTFSFIYNGPNQVIQGHALVNGVTNLLSGVFTGARITGLGHTGSANLSFSGGGSLTYTSDVKSFGAAENEYSFNLLGAIPNFSASSGKSLNNFAANGGGNFSFQAVPEPLTWGLMIMGFGGIGLTLRARRRRPLELA
jgi:hypothetical protein